MSTPHERSVGARMERKAMRAYLRRQILSPTIRPRKFYQDALYDVFNWVLSRQQRYDKRPGGLGKR